MLLLIGTVLTVHYLSRSSLPTPNPELRTDAAPVGPHLNLAAAYSELGKEAEARAEIAEVLRLNPQFSLEVHKERAPIKDPAMLERHIAALRKAGLK